MPAFLPPKPEDSKGEQEGRTPAEPFPSQVHPVVGAVEESSVLIWPAVYRPPFSLDSTLSWGEQ